MSQYNVSVYVTLCHQFNSGLHCTLECPHIASLVRDGCVSTVVEIVYINILVLNI